MIFLLYLTQLIRKKYFVLMIFRFWIFTRYICFEILSPKKWVHTNWFSSICRTTQKQKIPESLDLLFRIGATKRPGNRLLAYKNQSTGSIILLNRFFNLLEFTENGSIFLKCFLGQFRRRVGVKLLSNESFKVNVRPYFWRNT